MESKKAKLIEAESRMVLPGIRDMGTGEMLVNGYKLPVRRWISLGDLMYSIVIIVNNNVLCT